MKVTILVPFEVNLEDINDMFVHQFLNEYNKQNQDNYYSLISYVKEVVKNYTVQNLTSLPYGEPTIYEADIPELTDEVI